MEFLSIIVTCMITVGTTRLIITKYHSLFHPIDRCNSLIEKWYYSIEMDYSEDNSALYLKIKLMEIYAES